jgi:hypothetical protein
MAIHVRINPYLGELLADLVTREDVRSAMKKVMEKQPLRLILPSSIPHVSIFRSTVTKVRAAPVPPLGRWRGRT